MRVEGEQCGGACDSFGKCATNLECFVDKPKTSPFSFAILMGNTNTAGVCVSPDKTVEERRALQLGGRTLAGGAHETSVESPEVAAAAKHALTSLMRSSNSLTPPTLVRVVSAKTQVRILRPRPVFFLLFFSLARTTHIHASISPHIKSPPPSSHSPSQVVAGIKYILELELSDGSHHRVSVVDQAWMNPRYSMVSHEVL